MPSSRRPAPARPSRPGPRRRSRSAAGATPASGRSGGPRTSQDREKDRRQGAPPDPGPVRVQRREVVDPDVPPGDCRHHHRRSSQHDRDEQPEDGPGSRASEVRMADQVGPTGRWLDRAARQRRERQPFLRLFRPAGPVEPSVDSVTDQAVCATSCSPAGTRAPRCGGSCPSFPRLPGDRRRQRLPRATADVAAASAPWCHEAPPATAPPSTPGYWLRRPSSSL